MRPSRGCRDEMGTNVQQDVIESESEEQGTAQPYSDIVQIHLRAGFNE